MNTPIHVAGEIIGYQVLKRPELRSNIARHVLLVEVSQGDVGQMKGAGNVGDTVYVTDVSTYRDSVIERVTSLEDINTEQLLAEVKDRIGWREDGEQDL